MVEKFSQGPLPRRSIAVEQLSACHNIIASVANQIMKEYAATRCQVSEGEPFLSCALSGHIEMSSSWPPFRVLTLDIRTFELPGDAFLPAETSEG